MEQEWRRERRAGAEGRVNIHDPLSPSHLAMPSPQPPPPLPFASFRLQRFGPYVRRGQ